MVRTSRVRRSNRRHHCINGAVLLLDVRAKLRDALLSAKVCHGNDQLRNVDACAASCDYVSTPLLALHLLRGAATSKFSGCILRASRRVLWAAGTQGRWLEFPLKGRSTMRQRHRICHELKGRALDLDLATTARNTIYSGCSQNCCWQRNLFSST